MIIAQQISGALGATEPWLFYPFAFIAVVGALGVVLSKHIVRMAVYLLFTLGAVAFLYFLLAAEFLAVIQLVVYVGGTLILIIFGIMLTSKNPFLRLEVPLSERYFGWVIGIIAVAIMISLGFACIPSAIEGTGDLAASVASGDTIAGTAAEGDSNSTLTAPGPSGSGVEAIGRSLLLRYLVPFELAGVVLLVVMIGAAYLAKGRHEDADDDDTVGAGRGPGNPTAKGVAS